MEIVKNGKPLLRMPKNFEGGCRDGTVFIMIDDESEFVLSEYATFDRASEVLDDLSKAFISNEKEFVMPET